MSRSFSCVLAVLLFVTAGNVYGFNAHGHKVIAEVAWRKLNANQRQAIVDILREHPRFDENFDAEMPQQVRDQGTAAQDHWIFCQAAIWPDIARDQPDYHRARWHYINLPIFLSDEQAAAFSGNLPANVEFSLPRGGDEKQLNGVQAVKNSLRIVNSASASDEERAIHYCWLLHVIPDLAQPLHSAALFTEELFPTGDQGGNKIRIRREGPSGNGQKLHAVWDGLLGSSSQFNSILSKADQIITAHSAEFYAPFVALPNDAWSTESQPLAVQFAYGPLLDDIEEAEEDGRALGVIEVPASYYAEGGETVRRQAVLAGVRLAGVLAATAPVDDSPTPLAATARGVEFPALVAVRTEKLKSKSAAIGIARGDEDLAERIVRLEAEVSRLQALVEAPRSSRRAGVRSAAMAAALKGDGEQCDCGAEE